MKEDEAMLVGRKTRWDAYERETAAQGLLMNIAGTILLLGGCGGVLLLWLRGVI